MTKLSGFTFIHNAVSNGLPIFEAISQVRQFVDEMVVIDLGSTDETSYLLRQTDSVIYTIRWEPDRDFLNETFTNHPNWCSGDVIIFFEADEVYDTSLLHEINNRTISRGQTDLAVYRLQLGQNFQRCRWYPVDVHRVFPNGGGSYVTHPVKHPPMDVVPPDHGYLWDCSNNFRDCISHRRRTANELWGNPRRLFVREHFTEPVEVDEKTEQEILGEPHWLFRATPFNIPDVLKRHLGKTKYEPVLWIEKN